MATKKSVALALGLASTLLVFACVGSDPNLTSVPNEEKDSGSGSSSSGDAGPNVLERGDFEAAKCNGWEANVAEKDLDLVNRHNGASSCQVCGQGTDPTWGIFQSAPNLAIGTYIVTAFVRPSGDKPPSHVNVGAQRFNATGDVGQQEMSKIILAAGDDWQSKPFDIQIENAGEGIRVGVAVDDTVEGCFLVDDFTLSRKPL